MTGIKVFLSHQKADAATAASIAARLRTYHQIESYLDVIDPYLNRSGEDLASHIREQMGRCTQLLAVVSYSTSKSQWVPWEIGVATEKDFPLATYAAYLSAVPEFLAAWPYLRDLNDVDEYARASKAAEQARIAKQSAAAVSFSEAHRAGTKTFFNDLRNRLRQ